MTSVDPGQARRLLERELERGEYSGAHVTWWDRASRDVLEWFGSLRPDGFGGAGVSRTLLVVAIVVLVAVVVLVVVSRGLPRRRARLRADDARGVLDDDDLRSAAAIADAARAALRAGDWSTAVLEGYRAVARGLGERDLVPDVPGATASAIAVRASRPFPAFSDDLHRAATTFDAVRYLGLDTDEAAARQVLDTESRLRTARPARSDVPAVPA
ncbi:DUF4129 domain-containing protein [Curtobacterium sp. VKM Ac-2865]|uniref:DUF4129 domain-containing protein n=1 Tax=Curtobacterium sp. VKM Ac-2865 TaxID=2783817 RepID=UPI00188B5589|nr:DUF4129 domain-containing protein [Curtobacterium sp. VKM Ac-2865]MBF4584264.1 DUF4129 domain-containing protein [Curtobacterium sp. VKM Ac-2865]